MKYVFINMLTIKGLFYICENTYLSTEDGQYYSHVIKNAEVFVTQDKIDNTQKGTNHSFPLEDILAVFDNPEEALIYLMNSDTCAVFNHELITQVII